MADKYHINPETGNPNKCVAQPGNCRYGSDANHYENKADARQAYEGQMSSKAVATETRKSEESAPAPKSNIVTRSASGKITWASKEIRDKAINDQLKSEGYTVKIGTEMLGKKYYISRSATIVSGQIERAFATEGQLNKYLREWNRYDHMYDSINVIHRDDVINRAANRILRK